MQGLIVNNNYYPQITEAKKVNENLINKFFFYLDSSEKTKETYKKALRQMIKYFIQRNILRPTRFDILSYKDYLKESGKKPTTIQNYITAVKIFFKWTSQEKLYDNIADHIKGAKIGKEYKKDYLTTEQIKKIILLINKGDLTGKRNYAIFSLMVTGGLRDIEVTRANIEDIRPLGDKTVLFIQGKGKQEKTDYIILSLQVQEIINDYLTARGKTTGTEPLFTSTSNNSSGNRLSTRSVSGIIKSIFIKAGYNSERLTAHSLRHTAVTLALLSGQDIMQVQQFARHSNINTTMIYNHAIDKAKNTCSQSITDQILKNN